MISGSQVDRVNIEERVAKFCSRSIKKSSKLEALKMVIQMMDLTTLEAKDTASRVQQLCQKARCPHDTMPEISSVAAVCVYPNLVRVAKKALEGSSVKVASVATSFPSGMSSLKAKLEETRWVLREGADEVDMVISRGKFLAGEYREVQNEIRAMKEACGEKHLKVILETGELPTFDHIRLASDLAMDAGADFIKTSTGKVKPAATLPVTLVMLEAIRDHYYRTGRKVGMKPAGGIQKAKLAIQYLVMLRESLGQDWLTPDYFRFGASSLLNDVLRQIQKEKSGVYQSFDYFTKD